MTLARTPLAAIDPHEHRHCQSALKVLGITMTRRQVRESDRDWLLHDIRSAYIRLMKECHPDVGGSVRAAQALTMAKRALERILKVRVLRLPSRETINQTQRERYRKRNPTAKARVK